MARSHHHFGISTLTAALLLTFILQNRALAQYSQRPYSGYGRGMMGSIMWGYSGGIFMLLFWILIIVALVALIRWLIGGQRTGSGSAPGPSESALDILKKRYARGEISKEQFESMKRHIE